jgi:hypothetical protein
MSLVRPDEHERRVTEEEEERTGKPGTPTAEGSENRYTGEGEAPSYETEVTAEREGTDAREVEREEKDAEREGEAARWFTG